MIRATADRIKSRGMQSTYFVRFMLFAYTGGQLMVACRDGQGQAWWELVHGINGQYIQMGGGASSDNYPGFSTDI